MSELTRVKNSLKQEGSQNGVTPKATRRVTKQREMGFSEASIEKVDHNISLADGLHFIKHP